MSPSCDTSVILLMRRHFYCEIIILCLRWYLTYNLSYRDVRAMMAERGGDLAHTTIMRWVQRSVPEFTILIVEFSNVILAFAGIQANTHRPC